MSKVNKLLSAIDRLKGFENSKEKGNTGEEAVIEIVKEYISETNQKAALWHSATYHLVDNLPGNFKVYEDGLFATAGVTGEIDLLLLTEFHIIIIEVKTYNAYVAVEEDWTYKGSSPKSLKPEEWCNLCQVEKSARHMYQHLYTEIPYGDERYIQPVLVYSQGSLAVRTKDYNICILDDLKYTLNNLKRLEYKIDFEKMKQLINDKVNGERII